ncbi:hypothetical protein ACWD0A_00765 [Streptomyces sp. NPDC002867]
MGHGTDGTGTRRPHRSFLDEIKDALSARAALLVLGILYGFG